MAECYCTPVTNQIERFQELDQIIEQEKGHDGALVVVLHRAQELFGYLPDEVIAKISDGLGVSFREVYELANFYSNLSLKPRGKYVINLCMGTSCYMKGAPQVLAELEKELNIKINDTTSDGKFTLEITRCLGACGLGPVLTVNEDIHTNVTPEKIPALLKKYSREG